MRLRSDPIDTPNTNNRTQTVICMLHFVGVTKWSIQITVCVLLFVFGVSIGSDRNLIDNLYNFGWQAAVIACLGVLGSIVAARVAQRLFFKKGGES